MLLWPKHSATSNVLTPSLPSLLNLSTGEKPRGGEEYGAERRAGGGREKTETQRARE